MSKEKGEREKKSRGFANVVRSEFQSLGLFLVYTFVCKGV